MAVLIKEDMTFPLGLTRYLCEEVKIIEADIPTQSNAHPMCFQRISNADRIRAMTDEELAKWISSRKETCPPIKVWKCSRESCRGCWLEWLKEEVDDG